MKISALLNSPSQKSKISDSPIKTRGAKGAVAPYSCTRNEALEERTKGMSAHEWLIAIMAVFAVLGALDRIIGNKFGLGKEFEDGILAMGSLALAMVGIISLAPVLAAVLKPVVVPVYTFWEQIRLCLQARSLPATWVAAHWPKN